MRFRHSIRQWLLAESREAGGDAERWLRACVRALPEAEPPRDFHRRVLQACGIGEPAAAGPAARAVSVLAAGALVLVALALLVAPFLATLLPAGVLPLLLEVLGARLAVAVAAAVAAAAELWVAWGAWGRAVADGLYNTTGALILAVSCGLALPVIWSLNRLLAAPGRTLR